MKPPTFCALVANYNDAPTLEAALTPLIEQTVPFDRILVVNDGSTDNSLEVLNRLHAPRIGRWMDIPPLRILGSISYSIFLIHPIYLLLNFPDLKLSMIDKQYEFWKTFPQPHAWYLPFVFFPGILLWAAVMFVAVERPFIAWGHRRRQLSAARSTAATPSGLSNGE